MNEDKDYRVSQIIKLEDNLQKIGFTELQAETLTRMCVLTLYAQNQKVVIFALERINSFIERQINEK